MAELTAVYAKYYQDGHEYQNPYWPEAMDGGWRVPGSEDIIMIAGRWNSKNQVLCIKFELPTPAKAVTFSFCNQPDGVTEKAILNYKITSAEDASLHNAKGDTIGDGTITIAPNGYVRNTLTFQKMMSAGTHYLYIWTSNYNIMYYVMRVKWRISGSNYDFWASYEQLEHLSRIMTADGVEAYHDYIKTDGKPELYAQYVYTNGAWEPLGG